MRIASESKGEVWKIGELIETLRVEIEVRETSEWFKIGERQKQGENPTQRVPQTTGSTVLSRESGQFKVNCPYCNALHYSASCQSVTDPDIKTETLHLNTFGDNKHQRKSCQVFDLFLCGRANDGTRFPSLISQLFVRPCQD